MNINRFCIYVVACTFHVAKSDTDAVLLPIFKDQTTLQYRARMQQGTPSMLMSLTVDLGGPFSWIDCSHGYKSSTYGPAHCGLAPCASFGPEQTCGDCRSGSNPRPGCNNNTCSVIAVNPINGKSVVGEVASDIITVHSTEGLVSAHTDFVCATTRLLQGLSKGVNGVVGFGRGRSSLLTQFDSEFSDEVFRFPLKFAICLSSSTRSSGFAIFGNNKFSSSKSLQFTPMIQNLKGDRSTDYYLNVNAININGKQVQLNTTLLNTDSQGNGGTKISTVHPYTCSVTDAFTEEVNGAMTVQPVKPFGACYESKGLVIPVIDLVLHKKSVSWKITGTNSMVRVNENISCLGFVEGGVNSKASVVIRGHQLEDNLLQFSVTEGIGFSSLLLSKESSCANFNLSLYGVLLY
ncbi:hypothetical protein RND81_08G092000 [Saponaria officinalis]|uniref:Peptidase A1 domain-containing protein n=1 Tax=Saponaria officinalis TaxID=3572 RepID=A0AAW1J598_SAPOF